ncbi:MAG: diguanylate cyclase [Nitrosomonadales bacterium]
MEQVISSAKTIEIAALRKNGEEFPMELSISAFWFQHNWHALGVMRDITERKAIEEQIRKLAFYDALTALPNRRLFSERLDQSMVASKRSNFYGALLFLDLDNFKPFK